MCGSRSKLPEIWSRVHFALLTAALLLFAGTEARAECLYSLVYSGAIFDIPCDGDATMGHLVSIELLAKVADADQGFTLATRPDRGHIVLSQSAPSPGASSKSSKRAKQARLSGFKTANLSFVVNGTPTMARGRLVNGVPYVEATVLQTVLEQLGFNVLVAPESSLISVFRTQPAAGGGGIAASPSTPHGNNLLEMVQRGSFQSLQAMGAAGGGSSAGGLGMGSAGGGQGSSYGPTTLSASSSGVCQSMDTLRTIWDQTEPSAWEKSTMRALAQKFQEAKDNNGELAPEDVQQMVQALTSFRKKVDRRSEGTASWQGPSETRMVKSYGNAFMATISEVMNLSQDMMGAIQANDRSFVERAEDDIQRLKELESLVQQQGTQFNKEVIRIRNAHGCGPATLGLPPS